MVSGELCEICKVKVCCRLPAAVDCGGNGNNRMMKSEIRPKSDTVIAATGILMPSVLANLRSIVLRLCFSFHRLLVTTHNTMQEATSPENFLITKATRLFRSGGCVYDVKSTNWNLSVRLIDKFQNGFFLIYVVYGWRILRCYLCPKFFCSRIFLVVFYFPFAMID